MRVGLVCPYDVDVHGGVQRHVLELAETLRQGGDDVAVLAPGARDELTDGLTKVGPGVPIPFNGSVARVRFSPASGRIVRTWIDEGDFDLLHIHEPFTLSVSAQALWACSAPIVATFHTSQESPWLLQVSSKTLFRKAVGRVDGAIAVSEVARQTLEAYCDIQATIIPNGIHAHHSPQPQPHELGRPLRLVFVGRVDEPRKGLHVLLAALQRISEEVGPVELDVVGPGRPPRLGKRHRKNVKVSFHGVLDDAGKERMLRDADIFVAPNIYGESFGIILVEAMAAGTAVVASDLTAFRAVLEGDLYGRTFPRGDARALASAIVAAAQDPEGTRKRAEAAVVAAQRFDWPVVAAEVREVYEDSVEGFAGHDENPKDGEGPVDVVE
jgi:phosphatidylinositol alpha-mannosyltransferase